MDVWKHVLLCCCECLYWDTVASGSAFGASSQRDMIDRRLNDDVGLSSTYGLARFEKEKLSLQIGLIFIL
jgi:hypothetical protein